MSLAQTALVVNIFNTMRSGLNMPKSLAVQGLLTL